MTLSAQSRSALLKLAKSWRVPQSRTFTEQLAQKLWLALDTPKSLACSLLLKYGEYEQLLGMKAEAKYYTSENVEQFRCDYLSTSFLKKWETDLGFDRIGPALEKFLACEQLCQATNIRFTKLQSGDAGSLPQSSAVGHVILNAQRKIERILGDLNVEAWLHRCQFGPGADDCTKGPFTSAYHKLSAISATKEFADGARRLVSSSPGWERSLSGLLPEDHGPLKKVLVDTVSGNTVAFVPKTALIDRSIAVEARMNIYAQRGLGKLMRARLKRAGLDLDTQTPSQELARIGSLFGTIATLDLSSASDTVAYELVMYLLPPRWAKALEWCRSRTGTLPDGRKIVYEKFSSMGNGFTFELESLIFYALSLEAARYVGADLSQVRVFGDDIAVPTEVASLLVDVLTYCGFLLNADKSFTDGVFRESCGADFFNGVNVRPFFLKEELLDVKSIFRLANGLRAWAHRSNLGFGCSYKLRGVYRDAVLRLPPALRVIKIPARKRMGQKISSCVIVSGDYPLVLSERFAALSWVDIETDDFGLVENLDHAMTSSVTYNRRKQGWCYLALNSKPLSLKEDELNPYNMYIYALYASRDGDTGGLAGEINPRQLTRLQLTRQFELPGFWYDLGAWG